MGSVKELRTSALCVPDILSTVVLRYLKVYSYTGSHSKKCAKSNGRLKLYFLNCLIYVFPSRAHASELSSYVQYSLDFASYRRQKLGIHQ
jgi:hypothetical protein